MRRRRCISKAASRRLSHLALIIARDGECCVWCGLALSVEDEGATIEHVLPRSGGGPNTLENMVLACGPCNHSRQSTPALAWLAQCERRGARCARTVVIAALARARCQESPASPAPCPKARRAPLVGVG
jgi:hypothetical protein